MVIWDFLVSSKIKQKSNKPVNCGATVPRVNFEIVILSLTGVFELYDTCELCLNYMIRELWNHTDCVTKLLFQLPWL